MSRKRQAHRYRRGEYRWLTDRAKLLRKVPTPAEVKLYELLASVNPTAEPLWCWGRQAICEGFILDAFLPFSRICIEVDGSVHLRPSRRARDLLRDDTLRSVNVVTLRFSNSAVLASPQTTLSSIVQAHRRRVVNGKQQFVRCLEAQAPIDANAIRQAHRRAEANDPLPRRTM